MSSFKETSVTTGEVLKLAFPSILSMVSVTVQNFIDTAFISHTGNAQVAAVGLTSWYVWTLLSFFRGIASVTNTFTARFYGSERYRAIGTIIWHMLFMGLIFGVLYFLIGQFTPRIINLIRPPQEVKGYAISYLKIRFYEGFFIVCLFVLEEFFRGLKRPAISFLVIALISSLNIGLDYILIFGKIGFPAMGVKGAAIATVIAEFIGFCVFISIFFSAENKRRYLTARIPSLSFNLVRRIFRVGIPIGIQGVLDVAAFFAFGIIVARMGVNALAINQIVIQILSLTFMPGLGFSKASTTLVSSYMGAGDLKNARRSGHIAVFLALTVMVSIAASFVLIPGFYLSIFTTDKSMLELGSRVLFIAAISEAFDAVGLVFAGCLFGAGDTRFIMWTILLTAWGLFIPAAYILGILFNLGIVGAWAGLALYIAVFGIITAIRFSGKRWETINI